MCVSLIVPVVLVSGWVPVLVVQRVLWYWPTSLDVTYQESRPGNGMRRSERKGVREEELGAYAGLLQSILNGAIKKADQVKCVCLWGRGGGKGGGGEEKGWGRREGG